MGLIQEPDEEERRKVIEESHRRFEELARGNTLSNTGYGQSAGDSHELLVRWQTNEISIFVDGVLEISYSDPDLPTGGQFGLYQMFQQGFEFSAFEATPIALSSGIAASGAAVPEPSSMILLGLCAICLLVAQRQAGDEHSE